MADAVARQRYAGSVRPVELKQGIQEAPVAHPKRVEARREVGDATERRDDDHGDHGGANIVGEEELATAVVKMSNQLWIKYHSIKTKRNQPKPGMEMHHGALGAANHARRRSCRPRGRRRYNSSS